MKTLTEVIESITKQSGLEIRDVRKSDKDRFWVDRETYNDALHYLKVLQKIQKAQPLEKSEWSELYNQPLTWSELQQMEGKPVWVEALLYKQWAIIAYVGVDHIRFEGANLYAPEYRVYMGADNGWQAYRKERG